MQGALVQWKMGSYHILSIMQLEKTARSDAYVAHATQVLMGTVFLFG